MSVKYAKWEQSLMRFSLSVTSGEMPQDLTSCSVIVRRKMLGRLKGELTYVRSGETIRVKLSGPGELDRIMVELLDEADREG